MTRKGPMGAGLPTEEGAAGLWLCLYQPDRPHNFGGALRLSACLGVALHVVEPCGFPLSDKRIREGALDYAKLARWSRHADFAAFDRVRQTAGRRLVLLTTSGSLAHHLASYRPDDVLVLGSERAGAPDWLHAAAGLRVVVPMQARARSLNMMTAGTIVLGEAMRQTQAFDALSHAQSGPVPEPGEAR